MCGPCVQHVILSNLTGSDAHAYAASSDVQWIRGMLLQDAWQCVA